MTRKYSAHTEAEIEEKSNRFKKNPKLAYSEKMTITSRQPFQFPLKKILNNLFSKF